MESIDWWNYFYYDTTSPSYLRRATNCWCGRGNKILKHSIGDVAGNNSASHGYWVVTVEGSKYLAHRVIWEMFNGPIPDGYHIDHRFGGRENKKEDLRCVPRKVNMRNCKATVANTSGSCGVNKKVNTRSNGLSNEYWVASWQDIHDGRRKEKNFSVTKLGNEKAFELACAYRQKMIDLMNNQGAGYTERHGT